MDTLDTLVYERTSHQPSVLMDPELKLIQFEGNCVVEDALEFFQPIFEWLENFMNVEAGELETNMKLNYYNTASSKMIMKMFGLLGQINKKGTKVNTTWYYDEDDEDMLETAKQIADYSELRFQYLTL